MKLVDFDDGAGRFILDDAYEIAQLERADGEAPVEETDEQEGGRPQDRLGDKAEAGTP